MQADTPCKIALGALPWHAFESIILGQSKRHVHITAYILSEGSQQIDYDFDISEIYARALLPPQLIWPQSAAALAMGLDVLPADDHAALQDIDLGEPGEDGLSGDPEDQPLDLAVVLMDEIEAA